LQDKALAAEQAGAQLFAKVHLDLDRILGAHKGVLLTDQRLARPQLQWEDRARRFGRKGDQPLAAVALIGRHEKGLAGQSPPNPAEHAPSRAGIHRDIAAHPGHAALFRKDRLARFQGDVEGGHGRSLHAILHLSVSFLAPAAHVVQSTIIVLFDEPSVKWRRPGLGGRS